MQNNHVHFLYIFILTIAGCKRRDAYFFFLLMLDEYDAPAFFILWNNIDVTDVWEILCHNCGVCSRFAWFTKSFE